MSHHGASTSASPSSGGGGHAGGPPGSMAASLTLLANHDSMHKIRDLLPGDNSARTELLLSLLKTSYTSSLHSADVRMASLTQEVVSLRAQQTYAESKLRVAESLAEEAGRAVQEQRKRADMLMQENVRLKADNQALKAENQQLVHFKSILMSAANGVAGQQQQAQLAAPASYGAGGDGSSLYASGSGGGDFEFKQQAHVATPQQQPAAQSSSSFFFSPTKSRNNNNHNSHHTPMHESISISNMGGGGGVQQYQQSHHTPLPPYPKTSSYVHRMPSPLAADALSTPAPVSHMQGHQRHHHDAGGHAATPGSAHSGDILSEINAHLSSSRGRSAAAPSPARPYPPSTPTASLSNSFASSAAMLPGSGAGGGGGGANLVDQARALFQTAQSRLPGPTFGEFVSLVQQIRSVSSSGADAHAWDSIRHRAAQLLGPYQDIYALFEQLLQATQMQQQR